jgi:enoyl-CoA hydratase/carnithine racemase
VDVDLGWGAPPAADPDIVYSEPRPGGAVIRMNRPEGLNPWTAVMSAELVAVMDATTANPRIAVVVITGTGTSFSAGGEAHGILPTFIDSADALRWAREAALLNLRNTLQVRRRSARPRVRRLQPALLANAHR